MNMAWWFSFACITLIGAVLFPIKSHLSSQTNQHKNLQLNNSVPSKTSGTRDLMNRFQCPDGWDRLGGSCYYLSNVTTVVSEANQTCRTGYLNQSQLMKVRNQVDLFYAAHILNKHDIDALLIQIDSHWLQKRPVTVKLSKNDKDTSALFPDGVIEGENDVKQFEDISHICQQFRWSLFRDDANLFLLSKYIESGTMICAINDIDPNQSYSYLCQSVLDFCFGNDQCGQHGRCVNTPTTFRCSCYLYMDGSFCSEVSWKFLQLIIGTSIILFVSIIFKCKSVLKCQQPFLRSRVDWLKSFSCTCNPSQDTDSTRIDDSPYTASSESEKQEQQGARACVVGCSALVLLGFACIIPTICHLKADEIAMKNRWSYDLLLNNTVQLIQRCQHKFASPKVTDIFIIIVGAACVLFYILLVLKICRCERCTSSIEFFGTVNRYETAALTVLVMIEVLTTLEYFLIDISQLWRQGVLKYFLDRTLVPLFYSLVYYPLFISLRQKSRFVNGLAVTYTGIILVSIVIRNCLCSYTVPVSSSFSILDQAKSRLELGRLAVLYGLVKNLPRFIFISYIGAEFFTRLVYDSGRAPWATRRRTSPETPVTNTNSFDTHQLGTSLQESQNDGDSSSPNWWQKIANRIVDKDKNGSLTTMTMCAYTVAFSLLYYLTCVFAFQSMTNTSSMSWLTFCLEKTLDIEIEESSLHWEVKASAVLTTLLITFQLVLGINNSRRHHSALINGHHRDLLSGSGSESDPKSMASVSVGYIGTVFLNIVGGFLVWYYIILFVVTLCSMFCFRNVTFHTPRMELISSTMALVLPIIVLYGLKSSITRRLCTIAVSHRSRSEQPALNKNTYETLVLLTFVFSCHIAVFSTIFRLIKVVLLDILIIPRFDCSIYPRTWEKSDSAYMTYVSHLYMLKTYGEPAQLSSVTVATESMTVEPTLISPNQTDQGEQEVFEDVSDTDTVGRDSANDEESEDSLAAEAENDADDVSSVASSTIHRGFLGDNGQAGVLSSSSITPYTTTGRSHDRCLTSSIERRAADHELRRLMSDTYEGDVEEEKEPPRLPPKTRKRTKANIDRESFDPTDV